MKNIKWLNHIIELVIVILSILIAFSINKCSDNRKAEYRERIYLSSFLEELNEDLPALDTVIIRTGQIERSLEQIIDVMEGDNPNVDSLHYYINDGLFSLYVEDPHTTTFVSLQSSGSLDIIEGFELRKLIVDYNDLIVNLDFIKKWDFKHHNEGTLAYLPVYIKSSNERLVKDSELRALVQIRLFLIRTCLARYQDVRDKGRELRGRIEREIKQLL